MAKIISKLYEFPTHCSIVIFSPVSDNIFRDEMRDATSFFATSRQLALTPVPIPFTRRVKDLGPIHSGLPSTSPPILRVVRSVKAPTCKIHVAPCLSESMDIMQLLDNISIRKVVVAL